MRTLVPFLFALFGLGSQPSYAQSTDEASLVVSEVLSSEAWVSEAERCPVDFVQPMESTDRTSSRECGPSRLKSCLTKCQAGVPGACYWLGQAVRGEGRGQQAAEVLYQRSCKLGVASGCTNRAAGMSYGNEGSEAAQSCAARTFEKTCALEDLWGCTMYALHLSRGIGTPVNRELALEVLKKSCKYGSEDEACSYADRLREQIIKTRAAVK